LCWIFFFVICYCLVDFLFGLMVFGKPEEGHARVDWMGDLPATPPQPPPPHHYGLSTGGGQLFVWSFLLPFDGGGKIFSGPAVWSRGGMGGPGGRLGGRKAFLSGAWRGFQSKKNRRPLQIGGGRTSAQKKTNGVTGDKGGPLLNRAGFVPPAGSNSLPFYLGAKGRGEFAISGGLRPNIKGFGGGPPPGGGLGRLFAKKTKQSPVHRKPEGMGWNPGPFFGGLGNGGKMPVGEKKRKQKFSKGGNRLRCFLGHPRFGEFGQGVPPPLPTEGPRNLDLYIGAHGFFCLCRNQTGKKKAREAGPKKKGEKSVGGQRRRMGNSQKIGGGFALIP